MNLEEIVSNFASLTGDAVGVGLRRPEDEWARYVWVNHAFERMFGWSFDDLNGVCVSQSIAPESREDFAAQVRPKFEMGDTRFVAEGWGLRKDGGRMWISAAIVALPLQDDGSRYSLAVYRNLSSLKDRETQAKQALQEREAMLADLRAAEARLLAAINAIPGPLAIWDADFRLVQCNNSFAPRLLGEADPPEMGTPLEDILRTAAYSGAFTDAVGTEERWIARSVSALRSGEIHEITRYSDGRTFRADSVRAESGDTMVLSLDITELQAQKEKLRAYAGELEKLNNEVSLQARFDELTGCGNRRMLSETLAKAKTWREKTGGELAVLHIDLDRFKHINDTMGHAAGDAVLTTVAERLRQHCEPSDTIARMGGDEFVILLMVDPGETRPLDLADRLLSVLSRPVLFEGRVIRIGASIGIAETPLSGVDDLVTNADIALYQAKGAGKGRSRRYDERHLAEMTENKALADDLLRGLENDELLPFFQPQVNAQTGEVEMLEALVRWDHPEQGLLTPDRFLHIAAQLSVLDDIDDLIFRKSMAEIESVVGDDCAIGLALNISDERLMGDGIMTSARIAKGKAFPVAFELLETIYFEEDTDAFIFRIDALRDQGISIEVDDFGSGRASIIALERIAPDRLKIDRRLVAPIVESRKSKELVRSIVAIGRALGIGITAEGVETQVHADMLAELGCDRLQGFHFASPMPFASICDRFGIGQRKVS